MPREVKDTGLHRLISLQRCIFSPYPLPASFITFEKRERTEGLSLAGIKLKITLSPRHGGARGKMLRGYVDPCCRKIPDRRTRRMGIPIVTVGRLDLEMGGITYDAFSAVVPADAKSSARPQIHSPGRNKSREILWPKAFIRNAGWQRNRKVRILRCVLRATVVLLEGLTNYFLFK